MVSGQKNNLWIGKFSLFPDEVFVHGVSTRHGGVSQGCFDSLNLGLHVEDDAAAVKQNRDIFFDGLGLPPGKGVTCQQVHGSRIAKVTAADSGRGIYDYEEAIPQVDALVTNVPKLPLMLFFADCTPILLADPVSRAIGVAHGGWKGTVSSIAAKTVKRMEEEFGSRPENILAAIGPNIGACCYEVGDEVAQRFQEAFPLFKDKILVRGKSVKYHLDLAETNKRQLLQAGVAEENIDVAHVCTSCNNRQFFSYRGDHGQTGRIAAVLSIR